MKIAIIYGSTLGNTQRIAEKIQALFGDGAKLFDVKDLNEKKDCSELNEYSYYIFGTSTWGVGDLQDDWEVFDFKKLNLENKTAAIFGLGDSEVYAWTYCDSIAKLHRIIKMKKANIVGYVSVDGYKYTKSEAVEDDHFLGLALDEDNYEDLTDERVESWVENLKKVFV